MFVCQCHLVDSFGDSPISYDLIFCSFLLLSSIQLYKYISIYLYINLLMDIYIVSSLGLLQVMLPEATLFMSLAVQVHVFHLDVQLEVAVFKGYVYVPLATVKVLRSGGTNSKSH